MAERRAVVFVGPSLGTARPAVAGVEYRPPAARGDLRAAAETGALVIGLIDGVFHQKLAVTPREVRDVAEMGSRLFGASSLGAVRACECPDAMTGIGTIYEAFARSELTDDDEVALTFEPSDFTLMSYPMVQIREAAKRTAARFPDAAAALSTYLNAVHALSFEARTHRRLRELAERELPALEFRDALMTALTSDEANLKRRDALLLIDAVRRALQRE